MNHEKKNSTVPLKDIIEAKDYQVLIEKLAKRASGNASKGKYKDVIKRVYGLCKVKEDSLFLKEIDTLQIERNKIVHEKEVVNRDIDSISNAHTVIAQAIEILAESSLKKDIPGTYSCFERHDISIGNYSMESVN